MFNIRYLLGRSKDIIKQDGFRTFFHSSLQYIEFSVFGINQYLQKKYDLRHFIQKKRFGHVPHALSLFTVNPNNILHVSKTDPKEKWRMAGKVVDGDWDKSEVLFTDLDLYKAYVKRFKNGHSWQQTDFYQRVINDINSGQTKWGCQSESEFRDRCENLDKLYASIANNGYHSKKELIDGSAKGPKTDNHTLTGNTSLAKYDEVAIDIGRNGDLLFVDGRNRLAIARILNIPYIPVRVVKRHKKWQNSRSNILDETGSSNHPDLHELV